MSAVALSLDLANLGQDLLQASIVEVASTRASAVDAEGSGSGNESEDSCEGNHVGRM